MLSLRRVVWLALFVFALGGQVMASGFVQQGFYLHATEASGLVISGAQSGLLCATSGESKVCSPNMKIMVKGDEVCDHSDGKQYPCTRFGYEFDYAEAEAGSMMDCVAIYTDARGRSKTPYQHNLLPGNGHVFYPSFKTFSEVENRVILSEVHECSYQGAPVLAVEFMHYYEPATAPNTPSAPDRPRMDALPNACAEPHLTAQKAEQLLHADDVRPSVANEHIPTFWSQCIYSSKVVSQGQIGFVYKFMLKEMFNVHTLAAEQVQFNATFAAGNATLDRVVDDLGDRSFVFETDKRSTLLVITGIAGVNDGANRPTLLIANYYLNDPQMPQEERQALLIAEAREDLADWAR